TSSATPTTAPADIGIAALYPGDKGIGNDPNVIVADDFEAYSSATALPGTKWTSAYSKADMTISSDAYHGAKSLQMSLPATASETSIILLKNLPTPQTTLFTRAYMKWIVGYNVPTSNHNGICIGGGPMGMAG